MLIRWTLPATGDLTQICDYVEQHGSAATARRIALSIYDGVTTLMRFPAQGRIGRSPGTRELAVTGSPYLIVYRVRDEVIEILRILHGAQQWP